MATLKHWSQRPLRRPGKRGSDWALLLAPTQIPRLGKLLDAPCFSLLLTCSCLVPLGIILSLILRRPGLTTAIIVLVLGYEALFSIYLLLASYWSIRQQNNRAAAPTGKRPSIAAIIPSWNEAGNLDSTLEALLAQSPQPDCIVVADDGSSDNSIPLLRHRFRFRPQDQDPAWQDTNGIELLERSNLHPHLFLLGKPHTGKADTLNRAVALTNTDVVMMVDADTRLYQGAMEAVLDAFKRHSTLSAVGGVLVPRCSPSPIGRFLEFFQRFEYINGHVLRLTWSLFDATLLISGACGAFRRDVLLDAGGFSSDSWTEDYEVMFRLHQARRHRGRRCEVMVHPGFLAQTKAPSSLGSFLRQRRRWAGGFMETHLQHRHMVGDRQLGMLGLGHLVHNLLTLMQPLVYLILIPLVVLSWSSVVALQQTAFLTFFLLAIYAIYTLTAIGRLKLYRDHVGHCCDSYPQLILQVLSQFFLFRPLVVVAQLWGFSCVLRRRRSW